MRIAVLGPAEPSDVLGNHPSQPRGMGGVAVNNLVGRLASRGLDVHLVSGSTEITDIWSRQEGNLRVTMVPWRKRAKERALDAFSRERRLLASVVSDSSPDVVHAHWTYENALAALSTSIPTVITAHDAPVTILHHNRDAYRLVRLAMAVHVARRASVLTAVSPPLADHWRKVMRYRRRLDVIPNVVPAVADGPGRAVRASAGLTVLDVADGSSLKNARVLLRAFAIILQRIPDARLRLLGPGLADDSPIATWARQRHLAQRVTFLGAKPRQVVRAEMDRADVLCHCALEESQGLVLLEAMQSGLPVVAAAHARGVSWTLGAFSAGLGVDVRRPASVARGILQMVDLPGLRDALTTSAFEVVRQRFDPDETTEKYVQLYEGIAQ